MSHHLPMALSERSLSVRTIQPNGCSTLMSLLPGAGFQSTIAQQRSQIVSGSEVTLSTPSIIGFDFIQEILEPERQFWQLPRSPSCFRRHPHGRLKRRWSLISSLTTVIPGNVHVVQLILLFWFKSFIDIGTFPKYWICSVLP